MRFLAHGTDGALSLTARNVVLELPTAKGQARAAALRLRLVGANAAPRITGLEQLPGRVNYIIGNDRRSWITGVPTYARVDYHDVYPGVDLVYHGRQGRLEYDYVLRPDADPAAIALAREGAGALRLDAQGNLVLESAGGQVRQERPVAYQDIAGKRRVVAARFVLRSDNTAGFALGAYDRRYALTIDPVLNWSTYLRGGNQSNQAVGVASDSSGNVYVLDSASDAYPYNNSQCGQSGCAVVIKLTSGGTPAYTTYIAGFVGPKGIAADANGYAYIVGTDNGSYLPTANGYSSCPLNSNAAYMAKLSADGSTIPYGTCFSGYYGTNGAAIAVDRNQHAYITGNTDGNGFPVQNGYQGCAIGACSSKDAYMAVFDTTASGSASLLYSTLLGSTSQGYNSAGAAIAVDGSDNAYITGQTMSPDFPTRDAAQSTCADTYCRSGDAFVAELNPNASGDGSLVYSTYLGGRASDQGAGIAVDGQGNAYVTGATGSPDFPTSSNAYQSYCADAGPPPCNNYQGSDAFVSELSQPTNGHVSLLYSTYLGGNGKDQGNGIAVDGNGNVYVTGVTQSTDFPTRDAIQSSCGDSSGCGAGDAFVAALYPPAGGTASLLYSTYLGGSGADQGNGIAVDPNLNVDIAGATNSNNFPGTNGNGYGGGQQAFASQIAPPLPTISGISPSGGATDGGTTVTIYGQNFQYGVSSVTFGGASASYTVSQDGSSLTVTTPTHDIGGGRLLVRPRRGDDAVRVGEHDVHVCEPARGQQHQPQRGSRRRQLPIRQHLREPLRQRRARLHRLRRGGILSAQLRWLAHRVLQRLHVPRYRRRDGGRPVRRQVAHGAIRPVHVQGGADRHRRLPRPGTRERRDLRHSQRHGLRRRVRRDDGVLRLHAQGRL